jgi:hypothetical protein
MRGSAEQLDDLMQVAYVGLLRAAVTARELMKGQEATAPAA